MKRRSGVIPCLWVLGGLGILTNGNFNRLSSRTRISYSLPFLSFFLLRKKDNTPKNTYLLTQSLDETLGAYTYLVKKYFIVPLHSVWTKP